MDKCNKCGKCCFPRKNVNGDIVIDFSKRCVLMNDDNSCSVYKDRKVKCKEFNICCLNREDSKINIKGCGYNRKEWGEEW